MPQKQQNIASPVIVFITLLAVIFGAEGTLMLLLDHLLHDGTPLWLVTLLDAGLLTLICFPFLWLFFLRPMQRALSIESRKAQAIMETVVEGIVTVDDQNLVQTCNRSAGKIFGYTPGEIIGHPIQMLFAPGEPVSALLQHSEKQATALQGRHKNNYLLPLEVSISTFFIGGMRQLAIVIRDVSERVHALAALQESEERYRLLFNSGNDAMFVHSINADETPTRFFDVNEIACKRLGYTRDELLALSPFDIDAPDDKNTLQEVAEQLRNHGHALFEKTHITKNGQRIPVEISTHLFELQGQKLVLSIARDITERKHAEELLLLANEQLEGIFSNTHVLTAYLDSQFNFIRVNHAYASADGREEHFFTGKNHFDLYPNPENFAIFQRVVETGTAYIEYAKPFEYPDHPDWGITYWDWSLHPVKDKHGKVIGLILSLINVTERKRAELAHEDSERNAKALLNATTESIVLVDTAGTILAINEIAAQRFKREAAAMIGQDVFQFMPSDLARQRKQHLQAAIDTGKPLQYEDERDGMRFEVFTYPVIDAQGKVARLAIYATDVTERRLLQSIETSLLEINQMVLRGAGMPEVLDFICSETARLFQLEFVWIGRKEADGSVNLMAGAGPAAGYRDALDRIGVRWDNSPQSNGPAGLAIRHGEAQLFKADDPRFAIWSEAAGKFGLKSVIGIPLMIGDEIYGTFTLYSHFADTFDAPPVRQRLLAIASRISVALEMAVDHEKLRLLVAALEAAGNAIFITGRNGHIEWVNHAFTQMSGYTSAETIGQNISLIKSGNHDAAYYQNLWTTITRGEIWSNETIERHKDGHLYTVQQTITPIRNEAGAISHFIAIHEDITAKKQTEERIRHMAEFDALTNLPNRALFYDRLKQSLAIAKRNKRQLALLFLDLDGFKQVNDSFGHHVGDLLLKAVTLRLKKCARESDIIARLGGDEFTIILPEVNGRTDSITVAEKIIALVAKPYPLEGHDVRISASIGIAHYAGSGSSDPDKLVNLADRAMYEAKKQGKNSYRFSHDPLG